MRALLKALVATASALLLGGCLSSGAGYDLARQTVRDRTDIDVPSDEESEAARKKLVEQPLTADAAARLALLNNPNLQVALGNVGVGRAALLAALRLPNPHAEVGAHFHDDEVDLELTATLNIVPLLMLPAREAAASELLDAASLEAAGMMLDIVYGAKIAFYEYQAAAQVLELRKTVTYAAAQSAEIAARLLQAGNITDLAALNERALYEETRLALARAEAGEATARERLNGVLGLFGEDGARWTVASRLGDPDAFDAEGLEAKAVEANLDIAAFKKRYGAASVQADLAWAEGFLPSLEVGASAEREDGHWEAGPHVGLGLPLFYQGQAEVAAAEAQMNIADGSMRATAVRVRSTARALVVQLETARSSAEFYKKTLLPLRERIVDETLRQYNAMDLGPFQLLQAKRDQIETARAYVEVLRDYWVTRSQVEMLLAGRAPTMPTAPATAAPSPGGSRDAHD